MSLPKPLTLRHLCHLLNNILVLFYHRHIVFLTISLVKSTKCYLPKKSAPEWPRNTTSNYLLSSSKGLQLRNPFSNLKACWPSWESILAPLGFVHHSLEHYTAGPIAEQPHLFILPNRFLPLWNQCKRAPRPSGFEHHNTTLTFLFYLTLLFHSWANLLYGYSKVWAPRLVIDSPFLDFEHHNLNHYTTTSKAGRLQLYLLYLILFFSLSNRLKKTSSWPSRESSLAH